MTIPWASILYQYPARLRREHFEMASRTFDAGQCWYRVQMALISFTLQFGLRSQILQRPVAFDAQHLDRMPQALAQAVMRRLARDRKCLYRVLQSDLPELSRREGRFRSSRRALSGLKVVRMSSSDRVACDNDHAQSWPARNQLLQHFVATGVSLHLHVQQDDVEPGSLRSSRQEVAVAESAHRVEAFFVGGNLQG